MLSRVKIATACVVTFIGDNSPALVLPMLRSPSYMSLHQPVHPVANYRDPFGLVSVFPTSSSLAASNPSPRGNLKRSRSPEGYSDPQLGDQGDDGMLLPSQNALSRRVLFAGSARYMNQILCNQYCERH